MEWMNEPPFITGFYLRKIDEELDLNVYSLYLEYDIKSGKKRMGILHPRPMITSEVYADEIKGQWYGPIPVNEKETSNHYCINLL